MFITALVFCTSVLPITICYFLNNSLEIRIKMLDRYVIINNIFICFIMAIIDIFLSWLLIRVFVYKLPNGPNGKVENQQIEIANDSFLPVYLGYFFVGFSINKDKYWELLIFVLILGLLIIKSGGKYFNPILLLFGYNFYIIKGELFKTESLVITKKKLNEWKIKELKSLKKLNINTLIDIEE